MLKVGNDRVLSSIVKSLIVWKLKIFLAFVIVVLWLGGADYLVNWIAHHTQGQIR